MNIILVLWMCPVFIVMQNILQLKKYLIKEIHFTIAVIMVYLELLLQLPQFLRNLFDDNHIKSNNFFKYRQLLLQCKYNNIFPSHLMHINRNRFHLIHYKARLEKALHTFKITMLNIEIVIARMLQTVINILDI